MLIAGHADTTEALPAKLSGNAPRPGGMLR